MATGFSTKDEEISAALARLAEQTGLAKTTIVKQALIMFEHDAATAQLMKLRILIYGQAQPAAQEDAHGS